MTLHSLADFDITSLSLDNHSGGTIDNNNLMSLVSTYTISNGQTHELTDVLFQTRELNKLSESELTDISSWTNPTQTYVNTSSISLISQSNFTEEENKNQPVL